MSRFEDMTIEELKDYISSVSDNPEDVEEAEEIQDFIDKHGDKKSKNRSLPFDIYFGDMNLTDEQKKNRQEFAEKMQEIVLSIIALAAVQEKYNAVSELMLKNRLATDYQKLALDYSEPEDFDLINGYTEQYANDFVDATLRHTDDEWYLSDDRARFNAENEANTILNRSEFTQYKKRGFTRKKWITMKDKRVRETHAAVDDEVIPIDDFFQVGEAMMLYPKDFANAGDHPEETSNCRCTLAVLS